jgi:hypothetical protein
MRDMTIEEAIEYAAKIADPDFIETFRQMSRNLEQQRADLQALYDATTHLISEIVHREPRNSLDRAPGLRQAYREVVQVRNRLRSQRRVQHNEDFWLKARREGVR